MDDVERGPQAEALESDLRSFFTEAASQNLSVLTDGSTKKGGPPVEVLIKRITSDPEAVRKALEEYAAFFDLQPFFVGLSSTGQYWLVNWRVWLPVWHWKVLSSDQRSGPMSHGSLT